ncbi:MAG: dodecin family protein [Woeseiaceae bacterium]|nr:dodecin family protein [Woeseiaceae bacterium]
MSVAKHVEVTASSKDSFEDAIRAGIRKTAKSVDGIEGAWVKEQKVVVKGDDVKEFRVTMKVTFIVK